MSSEPYILLVDDEPFNIFLLEELLLDEGYKTSSASSGFEALEIAKESKPALILLDIMMPDLDGFEVCRLLRENTDLQTIPIVFLTALDDDNSRIRGLEMMGDDYLTKPINTNLLLTKVKNILELQKLRENAVTEEKVSDKLRLFVPEQFLTRIAPTGVDSIKLGQSQEEEVTILFCDIRGFTSISENQSATNTFQWLNVFFTQMNEIIVSENGFIDKFLGDALMAVFDRNDHHCSDAINAAILMTKSLEEFNQNLTEYNLEIPLNIGIGIHTGKALIGTIGANSRMDSTVIGDVVNTAARLQELTKKYQCSIITSGEVINKLKKPNSINSNWLDNIQPRGKQQTIELYEIS
jgi:adenylate cyclase